MEEDLKSLEIHRYRINELSSEKLKSFRDEIELMKQEHPELVGATIYGSHVTGQSKESSDIDAFVFVDTDMAGLSSQETEVAGFDLDDNDLVSQQLIREIQEPLYRRIKESMGFTDEDLADISVVPISKKRIDNLLKERLTRTERRGGDLDDLFHLQLGNGLDPYRSYVLRYLEGFGASGDQVCRELMMAAGFMEGRIPRGINREPVRIQPQTVADAIKTYGLESVRPRYPISEEVAEKSS